MLLTMLDARDWSFWPFAPPPADCAVPVAEPVLEASEAADCEMLEMMLEAVSWELEAEVVAEPLEVMEEAEPELADADADASVEVPADVTEVSWAAARAPRARRT